MTAASALRGLFRHLFERPSWRLCTRMVVAGYCMATLAACSTTGRTFDSSALQLIVPGQTTLDQASALLGSEPVDVYQQMNGAMMARWANKSSLLTDAIYFRQELWLAFGADGRFERIVKKVNVPGSLKPITAPAKVTSSRSPDSSLPSSGSVNAPSSASNTAAPSLPDSDTVVTYPLK